MVTVIQGAATQAVEGNLRLDMMEILVKRIAESKPSRVITSVDSLVQSSFNA